MVVPLVIYHAVPSEALKVNLKIETPGGWKVVSGQGEFELAAESSTALRVEIETPSLARKVLKKTAPQEVRIHGEADGKSIGDVKLLVLLRPHALPR